jgi:hypothetical protein
MMSSRLWESWQQRNATRLLEMPPIVREYKPPAIQHAVCDDPNKR